MRSIKETNFLFFLFFGVDVVKNTSKKCISDEKQIFTASVYKNFKFNITAVFHFFLGEIFHNFPHKPWKFNISAFLPFLNKIFCINVESQLIFSHFYEIMKKQ